MYALPVRRNNACHRIKALHIVILYDNEKVRGNWIKNFKKIKKIVDSIWDM